MNPLKLICLYVVGLAKQVWLFPQSIATALKQKRQRISVNEFEAERLDRLRHPSKYLGR
jgi:hypothetical protein